MSSYYITISVLFGILLSRMEIYGISLACSFLYVACLDVYARSLVHSLSLKVCEIQGFLSMVPLVLLKCLVLRRLRESGYVFFGLWRLTHLNLRLIVGFRPNAHYVMPVCYDNLSGIHYSVIVRTSSCLVASSSRSGSFITGFSIPTQHFSAEIWFVPPLLQTPRHEVVGVVEEMLGGEV